MKKFILIVLFYLFSLASFSQDKIYISELLEDTITFPQMVHLSEKDYVIFTMPQTRRIGELIINEQYYQSDSILQNDLFGYFETIIKEQKEKEVFYECTIAEKDSIIVDLNLNFADSERKLGQKNEEIDLQKNIIEIQKKEINSQKKNKILYGVGFLSIGLAVGILTGILIAI